MPVHIEQMKTDVTAVGSEQAWTPDQLEMLVKMVLERLDKRDRERRDETRRDTPQAECPGQASG